MWAGPLHSAAFVERFLAILPAVDDGTTYGTVPRIAGMLQTALQEVSLEDSPFFYMPARLSKTLHCESPPNAALRGALMGLGYKVARSHCRPSSIKTDAPPSVVWEVMKRWLQQKPRKEDAVKAGTPGFNILQKTHAPDLNVVFDKVLGKEEEKAHGVVRYQVNPTAHWGPMARPGISGGGGSNSSDTGSTSNNAADSSNSKDNKDNKREAAAAMDAETTTTTPSEEDSSSSNKKRVSWKNPEDLLSVLPVENVLICATRKLHSPHVRVRQCGAGVACSVRFCVNCWW